MGIPFVYTLMRTGKWGGGVSECYTATKRTDGGHS